MDHVLAIGTTGMLSEATFYLAQRTSRLTCIARTDRSLNRFAGSLDPHGPTFTPLSIDYQNTNQFITFVKQAWERKPFDLVLAWFHDSGQQSLEALLAFLADQTHPTRFFHVMGSAAADPAHDADQFQPVTNGAFSYHQIILGFKIENGRSRWLYNHEISAGAIQAIQQNRPRFVVGTVEPWSARP